MDTEHQAVNSLDHIWYPTRDYNWNTCTAGPNTKTFGPPVRAAVYLPGQKRHFTDLPVELILAIACATDKPTDAARLLCTSRALHQIWETHLRYLTTNILRRTVPLYSLAAETAVLHTDVGVHFPDESSSEKFKQRAARVMHIARLAADFDAQVEERRSWGHRVLESLRDEDWLRMLVSDFAKREALKSYKGRPSESVVLEKLWQLSSVDYDRALYVVACAHRTGRLRKNQLRCVVANTMKLFKDTWYYVTRLVEQAAGDVSDHEAGYLRLWDAFNDDGLPWEHKYLVARMQLYE